MPPRRSRRVPSLVKTLFPGRRRRRSSAPSLPKRVPSLPRPVPGLTPPLIPPRPPPARRPARRKKLGRWLRERYIGPAGSLTYFVYIPKGLRARTRAPLLVLLHGCRQTAAEFAAATRFNELADRHGYIAVYPEQTVWRQQQRCWHWYDTAHQERGMGEPAIIAGITAQVTAEPARWRIDQSRVYVAGISAGGAMALVLAAAYPDVYAAVGVHSAPAYRSATNSGDALGAMAGLTVVPPPPASPVSHGIPPAVLFYGGNDAVVHPRNGQRVVEQWLAYHQAYTGGGRHPDRVTRHKVKIGRTADGRTYTVSRWYTARGQKALEHWLIDGLGHAWSGGAPNMPYSDPHGPRASTAMWRFFTTKRR